MQELYKRKKAVIQTLCLLALFGMYHLPAFPKNNDASLPIDTLIIRIPSVMRSDETAARHMIAALEKKIAPGTTEPGHCHAIAGWFYWFASPSFYPGAALYTNKRFLSLPGL